MSGDISHILQGWEYQPEEISVRIVRGEDGRDKVQMRVDLGVLQMEMDGRPDGARPEGLESWLEHYEAKARQLELAERPALVLGEEDCVRLWREAVQYYHRYLSFWHLQRYDLCTRDTARNLRCFAFVHKHAENDRFRIQFDQWRPYVTMMNVRARATPLVREEKWAEALEIVGAGIGTIRDFLDEYGQTEQAHECVELLNLEQWHEEIHRRQQATPSGMHEDLLSNLRRQLEEAVASEEFEEAARLRDEIRRLGP